MFLRWKVCREAGTVGSAAEQRGRGGGGTPACQKGFVASRKADACGGQAPRAF